MWPAERPRANLEILIAGCGTSQAARYALREPDARITAIDVSDTSLRHTARSSAQVQSGKSRTASTLESSASARLAALSTWWFAPGVLHHLPDPDEGLRALRDVLRPSGAMRLMVYARYGRAGIYMMQEYCRLLEIGGVGGRSARSRRRAQVVAARSSDLGLLRRSKDFRRPEAMADALLHPQDRAYTVPKSMLGSIDAACRSVAGSSRRLTSRNAGCCRASPHAARLAALPSRLQHAAVELFRGTMVSHSFIAYRDDRRRWEPADQFCRR